MQPQSEPRPHSPASHWEDLEVLLSARGVREAFKQRSEMSLIGTVQERREPLEKVREDGVQGIGLCEEPDSTSWRQE